MKKTIAELREIVQDFSQRMNAISPQAFSEKPSPSKWSRQEVVGHLIDSAQNNLRRFIVGQYEDKPKIIYDQDQWVLLNQYQQMKQAEIILLWRLQNERICAVLESMPIENYTRLVNTGKTEEQLHSLEWLAWDYVKHLKHHLNQIVEKSFDIVYP